MRLIIYSAKKEDMRNAKYHFFTTIIALMVAVPVGLSQTTIEGFAGVKHLVAKSYNDSIHYVFSQTPETSFNSRFNLTIIKKGAEIIEKVPVDSNKRLWINDLAVTKAGVFLAYGGDIKDRLTYLKFYDPSTKKLSLKSKVRFDLSKMVQFNDTLYFLGSTVQTDQVNSGLYLTASTLNLDTLWSVKLNDFSFGSRGFIHARDLNLQRVGKNIYVPAWDMYGGRDSINFPFVDSQGRLKHNKLPVNSNGLVADFRVITPELFLVGVENPQSHASKLSLLSLRNGSLDSIYSYASPFTSEVKWVNDQLLITVEKGKGLVAHSFASGKSAVLAPFDLEVFTSLSVIESEGMLCLYRVNFRKDERNKSSLMFYNLGSITSILKSLEAHD
tara:strand:- start:2191 stop:3348 length:1158 start_codon:yes stop_codon:yes gene_type:complete